MSRLPFITKQKTLEFSRVLKRDLLSTTLNSISQNIALRDNYLATVITLKNGSHYVLIYRDDLLISEIYLEEDYLEDIHNTFGVYIDPQYRLYLVGNMHNSAEFNGYISTTSIRGDGDIEMVKINPEDIKGAGFSYVSFDDIDGRVYMKCRKHLRPGMKWNDEPNLMSYSILQRDEKTLEFNEILPDGKNPIFNFESGVNNSPYQRFSDSIQISEDGSFYFAGANFNPRMDMISNDKPNLIEVVKTGSGPHLEKLVSKPGKFDFNTSLATLTNGNYVMCYTDISSETPVTKIDYNGVPYLYDYHNVPFNHKITHIKDDVCLVTNPGRFSESLVIDFKSDNVYKFNFNQPLYGSDEAFNGGVVSIVKHKDNNSLYLLIANDEDVSIRKVDFYI